MNAPIREESFQDESIDLRRYWRLLLQSKWRILSFSIVVSLLAVVVVFSLDHVYRASTLVLIESEEANVLSIEDVYGLNTRSKSYFPTQYEIMKSREVIAKVITELSLTSNPLFVSSEGALSNKFSLFDMNDSPAQQTEEAKLASVIKQFRNNLVITPVRGTQLVNIGFDSKDPKLAADIANTLSDVYIESHMEAKLQVTQKATKWLSGRLGDLRTSLQASEERLQQYREEAELVDVQGVQTLDAGELGLLTERLVEVKRVRSQNESIRRQVQDLGGSPSAEQLLSIPSILAHPLVQSLKTSQAEAERKVAELSRRYGPKHPKMISAQSESATTLSELRRQVLRVSNGIGSDYRAAVEAEQEVKAQLVIAKTRMQGVNRKEFKLRDLEREVQSNRQMYDMFLTRTKETDQAGGLQTAHARIIDSAVAPILPIKPNKKLIVAIAFVLAMGIAVVVVLLLDLLDNTVRTSEDVEEKLHASFLGFLPLVKTNNSEQAFEGFLSDSTGAFAEAIRTVRTGLILSNLDMPHKICVVTSSVPNEGKSTLALNLATAVGQMESVLLIDADMRRPTLASTLDIPRSAPGLSNLVAGTATYKECVHRLDRASIDVITAGTIPVNPLELLSSKRFSSALQQLGQHYDRIIIDSAPTHAVSDAMVLSTYADALVYVVKADETASSLAAKGIKRLKDVGAPITGVVLNQVDVEKSALYDSAYDGYYQGYGQQADDSEKAA